MKKILIVIGMFMLVISLGIAGMFYITVNSLKLEISQSQTMVKKLQADALSFKAEKEKIAKENEKLREDLASYLGVDTKAKSDKEKLSLLLSEAQKSIEVKEGNLQMLDRKLEELTKESAAQKKKIQENVVKKVKQLSDKVSSLETTLNQERAVFNYNLAVAYEQAGLDDEAIVAYEKSLKSDPKNADAYYNLGLLYKDKRNDAARAIKYLSSYLLLKPGADDKAEVEEWIKQIK